MDAKELLLVQINQSLKVSQPPIFTAVIEYPKDCYYKLSDATTRSPEELAAFVSHLAADVQTSVITSLDKARMDTPNPCGLTLVVLFTRNFEDRLVLDEIQFMDEIQFTAFKMNNGRKK